MIEFALPNNYDYRSFQQHIFNDTLHFGPGEKDSSGNITVKGKITADSFEGGNISIPKAIQGGDFNNFTTYGAYYSPGGYGYTHGPTEGSYTFYGVLLVHKIDNYDAYVQQTIIHTNTNKIYTRSLYVPDPESTSTSSWTEILTNTNHGNNTEIHVTEEDRYILNNARPINKTIVLDLTKWVNNQQEITVDGILADERKQLITITPASNSARSYRNNEVYVDAQSENTLLFKCNSIPGQSLTVYVAIQEVVDGEA